MNQDLLLRVKLEEYYGHVRELEIRRDEMQMQREPEIERYASIYNATLVQIWYNGIDLQAKNISEKHLLKAGDE